MILEYTAMGACLMEGFLMSNLVSLCLRNSRLVRCPILARSFGLIWSRLRTMSLCGCLARRKAVSLCWLHASLMVRKRLLAFPPMKIPRSVEVAHFNVGSCLYVILNQSSTVGDEMIRGTSQHCGDVWHGLMWPRVQAETPQPVCCKSPHGGSIEGCT